MVRRRIIPRHLMGFDIEIYRPTTLNTSQEAFGVLECFLTNVNVLKMPTNVFIMYGRLLNGLNTCSVATVSSLLYREAPHQTLGTEMSRDMGRHSLGNN